MTYKNCLFLLLTISLKHCDLLMDPMINVVHVFALILIQTKQFILYSFKLFLFSFYLTCLIHIHFHFACFDFFSMKYLYLLGVLLQIL